MMRSLVVLSFVLFSLLSCKKFDHQELELPNCELCDYAPTLEGSFRGYASGIAVPNYGDSMNIVLEQVFLGNSQYEDSTYIHYRVTYNFDSSSDDYEKIIRLKNTNGQFYQTVYAGSGSFVSYIDSVRISNYGDNGLSTSLYIGATLYRQ